MDKQNMIYSYSGILFRHKKEQSTDTGTTSVNPEKILLVKKGQS